MLSAQEIQQKERTVQTYIFFVTILAMKLQGEYFIFVELFIMMLMIYYIVIIVNNEDSDSMVYGAFMVSLLFSLLLYLVMFPLTEWVNLPAIYKIGNVIIGTVFILFFALLTQVPLLPHDYIKRQIHGQKKRSVFLLAYIFAKGAVPFKRKNVNTEDE